MELASRKQRAEHLAFAVGPPENATMKSAHRLSFSLGAATAVGVSFSRTAAQGPGPRLADFNSDMGDKEGSEKCGLFEREALPHVDALYSAALRLSRNPDDARDLLQETGAAVAVAEVVIQDGQQPRAAVGPRSVLVKKSVGAQQQVSLTPEDFEREVEGLSARGTKIERSPRC
jgi:hypothetical protein